MASGPAVSIALTGMRFPGAAPLFGPLRLDVQPGQVVALIGPSGIGKTTLLRMVAGLQRSYDGQITIGGQSIDQAPPPGFVFQDARLLPWLDAAANIRAVRPEIPAADLDQLLTRVGLTGLQGSFPRQLSGGMQRRLGLARAMSVNQGLLLLDEPFVSLDRAVVRDLQAAFLTIFKATDPTVILVTHDAEDAARLADRVIVLGGRPARITADLALSRTAPERGASDVARLVETILAAQKEAS